MREQKQINTRLKKSTLCDILIEKFEDGFCMTELQKRIYGAFRPADILLPPRGADMKKWCAVACDQYTSEPEYWRGFDEFIGEAPSSRRCILPEAFLSDAGADEIDGINRTMRDYLYNYLVSVGECMIYVERTLSDGRIRRGVVGAFDLEEYDFSQNSSSLLRSTELTVPERIPPRVTIRREAPIELPHALLLIDDESGGIINNIPHADEPIYDFELYGDAGHLKGYRMNEGDTDAFRRALSQMTLREYGKNTSPAFVVGDGNHSLAAAKVLWERTKMLIPKSLYETHPARFALVELTNLHDETLDFEPIYRVVKCGDPCVLTDAFRRFAKNLHGAYTSQNVKIVYHGGGEEITVLTPESPLPVGTVQRFIDECEACSMICGVDYIHGLDTAHRLADEEGKVAFIFDGIGKGELFEDVARGGSLPRKTFSMGHAADKRFYCEAKRILTDGELTI